MSFEEIIFKDALVHLRGVYGGRDGHANVVRRMLELRNEIDLYLVCLEELKAQRESGKEIRSALTNELIP